MRFDSFSDILRPSRHNSWVPVAKVGSIFILVGLLIFALKEIVIFFIASVFIFIGIVVLYIAFKIWKASKYF